MSLLLAAGSTPPVVAIRLPGLLIVRAEDLAVYDWTDATRVLRPGFRSGIQRLPGILLSTDLSDQFPELDLRSAFLKSGFVSGVQRLPTLVYSQRWVEEPDPYTEIRSQILSFGSFVAAPDIPNTRYWFLYGIAYDGYVYEDLVGNYRSVVFIPGSAVPPAAGIIWKPLFARAGRGRLGR